MPGVYQSDPPGLMHDDLRLLPPLAGVVSFWGVQLLPGRPGATAMVAERHFHSRRVNDPQFRIYPQIA